MTTGGTGHRYTSIILSFVMPILLVISIGTSNAIDAPLTSMFDFIASISTIYYLLYYFTVGVMAYIGYSVLISGREIKERLVLYVTVFFAILLISPSLLFLNPVPAETYHHAQIFSVLKHGNVSDILVSYKSVGNPLFWSILTTITSVDAFIVVLYIAPILMWTLTILFLYVVLRRVAGYELAFIGALYFISSNWLLPVTAGYTFAPMIFVMLLGCFLWLERGDLKLHRPLLGVIVLLFAALTISHPAYSLFPIITTSAIYLFRRLTKRSGLKGGFAAFFPILYSSWYILLDLFPYGYLESIKKFVDRLAEGLFQSGALEKIYVNPLKPEYELTLNMRVAIGILFMVIPLVMLPKILNFENIFRKGKILNAWIIAFLGTYVSVLMFALIGFLVGIYGSSPFLMSLLLGSVLMPLLIDLHRKKRMLGLREGTRRKRDIYRIGGLVLLAIIVTSSCVAFYTLWLPSLLHIQTVPTIKVACVDFISQHAPPDFPLHSIGPPQSVHQSTLYSGIYGNRSDITISLLVDPANPEYTIQSYPLDGGIFLDGSAIATRIKYSISPSILERMKSIEIKLEEETRANLVYTSSPLYKFYIIEGLEGP